MGKQVSILRSQKGQSMVLITSVMVGMLALTGLAIDAGNLFVQRRNTQNAADAAALAGTRILAQAVCGDAEVTDAAIAATLTEFAQMNGVEDPSAITAAYTNAESSELGAVGAGSIPVGSTGVSVLIDNNVPTYFVKVLGLAEVGISAEALAMTGPPVAGGGARPVGIPIEVVDHLSPGDLFTINFGNCEPHPEECIIAYSGGEMQHRGWLNLLYVWNDGSYLDESPNWPRAIDPSGDANVLKEWIENGFDDSLLYSGDYIHAKPGRNSSVIREAPIGETILVPIFDAFPPYEEIPDPKPEPAHQGSADFYHIVGFLAFVVTDSSQGGGWIEGEAVEVIIGDGVVGIWPAMGFGQSGACRTMTQAVNLWR